MEYEIQKIRVPQMGEGQIEVRVLSLHIAPGASVEKDSLLYEVETDKAQLDLESPVEGVLSRWLVEEGDVIEIGAVVAEVKVEISDIHSTRVVTDTGQGEGVGRPDQGAEKGVETARVAPRTRKYALERGLDESGLRQIKSQGKVLLPADIDAYLAATPVSRREAGHGYADVDLTSRQITLNRSMVEARDSVVATSVTVELPSEDLTYATRVLAGENPQVGLLTEFQAFVWLAAKAAGEHGPVRSQLAGRTRLRQMDDVNIGISVAAPGGDLNVAKIESADKLPLVQFWASFLDAAEAANNGVNTVDSSVTLIFSHLGEVVHDATPLVVPPAVATLFLGGVSGRESGSTRRMVLAFDHRVFNGQQAADFLRDVAGITANYAERFVRDGHPGETSVSVSDPVIDGYVNLVEQCAREVVGASADIRRPLSELSIDSLRVTALTAKLNEVFDANLSPAAIYNCRTLLDVLSYLKPDTADYLRELGAGGAAGEVVSAVVGVDEPVAIVGMACRFPGGVGSPEDLW
ncbi:2-oxo acid dehydrogenase subunit E2, partial [Nocardia fluminea]